METAKRVQAWDLKIFNNVKRLEDLDKEIGFLEQDRNHIENELAYVDTQQDQLRQTLGDLERQVNSLVHERAKASMGMTHSVETERLKSYELAARIHAQLTHMNQSVTAMILTLNTRFKDSSLSPEMQAVLEVLNHHLQMLKGIDGMCAQLKSKVDSIPLSTAADTQKRSGLYSSSFLV